MTRAADCRERVCSFSRHQSTFAFECFRGTGEMEEDGGRVLFAPRAASGEGRDRMRLIGGWASVSNTMLKLGETTRWGGAEKVL